MSDHSTDMLNRRGFVGLCAGAAAGMALGCATTTTRVVRVEEGRVRVSLADHPELTRRGGTVRVLPQGAVDPVFVIALDAASTPRRFVAISSRCTHRGCTVDSQGALFVCPCHGSTYDQQGAVLRGPAERALTSFTATERNGFVEVDLRGAS